MKNQPHRNGHETGIFSPDSRTETATGRRTAPGQEADDTLVAKRLLSDPGEAAALFTDVFAYFVGVKFGRHKMTPHLSPKKSWEGAVGGVICNLAFMLLCLVVFEKLLAKQDFFLPVWFYCIMVVFISVTSMFGDLMASLIKRYYGVKDYSNLIPGHGGIMDRFDSVLLASPTMYAFLLIFGTVVMGA